MPPIDDCYYAQKAKEIIQTGDWLTIHYAGEVSIDNAPFYIWLIAGMFKSFGISEYSARFFSAFFGVATIVTIYFLGRMLYDEWIGIFSSFVLLTTQLFFIFSRRAMVDVTLTFWVTLALLFFLKGMKKKEYFLLFGMSTGIAILTKSILGFFPILIVMVYLLLRKQFKKIMDPFFLLGIAVAFLVSLPWFFYQYIHYTDNFVSGHLQWLIYERAFIINKRGTPAWFLKKLFIVYWPWIPLATYASIRLLWRGLKKADSGGLFVLCWAGVVIGIMSCINDKKIHYIMSCFPALALLSALSLNGILGGEKRKTFFVNTVFAVLLLTAAIIIATPVTLPPRLSENNFFEYLVDDTCSIASFAKENLAQEEKIILYRLWLPGIRNNYLFYSDRDISGSIDDGQLFLQTLKKGDVKYGLAAKEEYRELCELDEFRPEILKETESLVLFTTT